MDDESKDMTDDAALHAFRQMQEDARERHVELIARLAETPDYAPSFALIQKTLEWLVERHSNPLTVEEVMEGVREATVKMDRPNREALKLARAEMLACRDAMVDSRATYEQGLQRARTIGDQARRNRRWLISGLATGAIVMTILPGLLARSMPSNWLLPERMAARTLRLSIADAGLHLLLTANPDAATEIVEGARLMFNNREAIAKCRNDHGRAKIAVTCRIKLSILDLDP